MVQRLGFSAFTRKARVRHPVWEPLSYEYFIHICISYIRHERIYIFKRYRSIFKRYHSIFKRYHSISRRKRSISTKFKRYRSIIKKTKMLENKLKISKSKVVFHFFKTGGSSLKIFYSR